MLIIGVLVLCLVIGLCVLKWGRWDWDVFGVIFTIVGACGLLLAVISLPIQRMGIMAGIQRIEAVRASRVMVEGASNFEVAAWRVKVAEVNADLAEAKYYNRTLFDIWYPDAIEAVEPIQ